VPPERGLRTDGAQEDSLEEIDAAAIVSGARRTRGKVVDYSSAEAHAKAGIAKGADDDDE
jgi:hypothetical protein